MAIQKHKKIERKKEKEEKGHIEEGIGIKTGRVKGNEKRNNIRLLVIDFKKQMFPQF